MVLPSRLEVHLPLVSAVFAASCGYSGLSLEGEQHLTAQGDGGSSTISAGGTDTSPGGAAGSGTGEDGSGGATGGRGEDDGWWDRGCYFNCPDPESPYLVFSNFETRLPGEQVEDGGAELQLETEIVHSGESSLKATQGEPESQAEINQPFAPVREGHLYFRGWLYIPEGSITSWLKLLAFHSGEVHGIDFMARADESIRVQILAEMVGQNSASGILPQEQWFCLQIDVGVSQFAGSVDVSINGKEVLNISQIDTDPADGLSRFVYGIADTGSQQVGATVYWDDVAVSTEFVSCDAGL